MMSTVSRVKRRYGVGAGAGCIADDLLLVRAAGGFAEASQSDLLGTLAVLGLDHPTDSEIDHARTAVRELTATLLKQTLLDYPIQHATRSENTPGTRVSQHWQTVAVEALRKMLLPDNGTKGMVVTIRDRVGQELDVDAGTVKRHEDKLIDNALAPRIHERLTSENGNRRRSNHRRTPPPEQVGDPLWAHLGATETDLAEALLRTARIPGHGFDAQEYGREEPSRASTGMITYALAMTPSIDDEIIAELYDEILSWITPGGVLPRRHGSNIESTWTESQCLLALTGRPHLVDGDPGPIRLADSLLRQQDDGGWSYRTGGSSGPHPLWSFYPLLALRRSAEAEWLHGLRYRDAADLAAGHAARCLDAADTIVDRLLGLAVLHLTTAGTSAHPQAEARDRHTQALADDVGPADVEELTHMTITDERQPLWYARVNPALLHLHARRVLGVGHGFTHALAARLLDEYDRLHQGWTNGALPAAKPYTWTTAIALRSCQLIRSDVRRGVMPWPLEPPEGAAAAAG